MDPSNSRCTYCTYDSNSGFYNLRALSENLDAVRLKSPALNKTQTCEDKHFYLNVNDNIVLRTGNRQTCRHHSETPVFVEHAVVTDVLKLYQVTKNEILQQAKQVKSLLVVCCSLSYYTFFHSKITGFKYLRFTLLHSSNQ